MAAQRISPQLRDIHAPAPLRDLPLWCVWAYEQHDGETKMRKVPQYSMGGRRYGRQGSPEDREKLTTFAVAREAAARRGLDGVGFALLPDAGIVALDFDNCVTDGRVDPEVLHLVQDTYSELSPSGHGVRAFFSGSADILGNRKSPSTAEQFGAEVFSDTGFCTVTGWMLPHVDLIGLDDTVAPLPKKVLDFCEKRFGATRAAPASDDFMAGHEPKLGLSLDDMGDLVNRLDPDLGRDEWIRVGMALHHETEGGEDGFELWNDWSANSYKYPSEEALRGQWDSFERRRGSVGRQVTMATVKRMVQMEGVDAATVLERAAVIVAEGGTSTGGMGTPADWQGKFKMVASGDISSKPIDWLVKGVIPRADIFSIYGASGAGKSFVALDLAAAIARGLSWRGHKVTKGRVAIVAAEGTGGYGGRIQALANKLCIDRADLDIGVFFAQPNILDADDISELVAAILAVGDVDLVLIDTLAQVTPGANENTSEDMGRALANCRIIHDATKATIGIIHHAGKDLSRGARGWSGLKGAMDAELEVNRNEETGAREIVVRKQKDGRDGDVFPFKLETVVLGHDEDGDAITSCIVVESDQRAKQAEEPKGKRRGRIETHLLEVMVLFGDRDIVPLSEVVKAAVDMLPEPQEGQRDTRRQMVTRALTNMGKEKEGPLRVEGGQVIFYE
jgi:RecA/RadA recombinase